jgi:hypothetical protein
MPPVVVVLVEVNRVRHVTLEGVVLALAECLEPHDELEQLGRVREFRRALAALLEQPLPQHAMSSSAGVPVELEAPRHELEQLADELEALARADLEQGNGELHREDLRGLAGELRERVAVRA